MTRTVSEREAKQRFSDILGQAAAGDTVVITRHGRPVAQLGPYRQQTEEDRQAKAWDRLIARLEVGLSLGGGTVRRNDLSDR